ncbi:MULTISPECIES: CGNR zinc finger domain-containing protein [Bradyrhizobium]|jgi:predicted RNA-binding Zn ribbon-like protein|uniref:CGNR zinc finger domain-containing protein n=1 Tax=Bradyrhizobium TaxID=374 RepID=UPI0004871C97|nr:MULTISPECIES: ABATE domain-containing protein [Bradyrhizobium]MCS3445559.1 putative RNA-binding Zn ribbon-like protein [Bradyrhizobium elkanii]MCS3563310.1 putative RNA-binding Zn ribbon-like protein [Bradyrhizobium elkanii]MCW2146855.1 putative RNA-binding Zn ribbon-like protein [Bradyrhizobium elkanii]MCW2354069.1 putative RNA-binding Zn ribbon-like protein [Bradyrhizobium elkanii]MCW2379685.1 putative RNA-binding Zn ribbon-like protein [Bradyrhizobium elkanii]
MSRVPSPEASSREELSIKFVNTVAWRLRDLVEDRIATSDSILKWLVDAELADRRVAAQLRARWKSSPREADTFLNAAHGLREALYQLFVARIGGGRADPTAVADLNRSLGTGSGGVALGTVGDTLRWLPTTGRVTPDALLKPIAWSAVSLLTGPRAERVKQCQDERGCGWLFVDESRAQNRRWCSMGDCGNLAKSRRHYQRSQAAEE